MVSGMFRETKFSAAGWTLLGKGIGLRVSAKAVVTFAGMYVVHGKATVQSTPPPPPPVYCSRTVAMLTTPYLDFL